jgi:hypothetical protein
MKHRTAFLALCAGLGLVSLSPNARAVPGFFATGGSDAKSSEAKSRSAQVVVLKNGSQNVVSVMADYDGPMDNFALVIPVPSDVSAADVVALKRGDVERIEELTAPRFHEFWEMDPCEQGKPQQIWEIDLSASESTDFLGAGEMLAGTTKAPPEMRIEVVPDFRSDSEYTFSVVGSNVEGFLSGKGLKVPEGVKGKLGNYSNFLVAMVDSKRLEVGGKGEALLSPIRFATKQPVKLATSLGTAHIKGAYELLVYVLDPKDRYEAKNFKNVFPPTNFQVAFEAKEKTGEVYAALHDKLLAKDKDAFLVEYAWSTKGCGEPCPNAPLHLSEILTLGADVQEKNVPEAERNPAPPERSEEEQAIFDAAKPEEKKKMDELAKEVARRKALIARQSDYLMTRLHHRYSNIEQDVELQPAGHVKGGLEIPKGEAAELPMDVSPADKSQLQTRLVNLHPSKVVVNCPAPERFRWGKPPATFRGARKIWVADGMAARDRSKVKLEELIVSPIAALGIPGIKVAADQAASAAAAKAAEEAKAGKCDCALIPSQTPVGATALGFSLLGFLAAALGFRRRFSKRA